MAKLLLFFLLFLASNSLTAQFLSLEWAYNYGGLGRDIAYAIDADSIGNIYAMGYYQGNVDFDWGQNTTRLNTPLGSPNLFIKKVDPDGQLIWVKDFSIDVLGDSVPQARGFDVDDQGNVFLSGLFTGTVDFDPGPGRTALIAPSSANYIYTLKLDPAGNLLWVSHIEGFNLKFISDISVDTAGNVYTVGRFQGKADFNPGPIRGYLNSASGGSVFIQKLNKDGYYTWAKQIGNDQSITPYTVACGIDGQAVIAGSFKGSLDFDPDTSVFQMTQQGSFSDAFILKLDVDGTFLWAKQMYSGHSIYSIRTTAAPSGEIYTTGSFSGLADFDPGPDTALLSGLNFTGFLQKLSPEGEFEWVKKFGEAHNRYANIQPQKVLIGEDESIYLSGELGGTMDADPGPSVVPLSASEIQSRFIVKLDSKGDYNWSRTFLVPRYGWFLDIVVDKKLNLYLGGGFISQMNISPGLDDFFLLPVNYEADAFLAKWSQDTCATSPSVAGLLNIDTCGSITINNITYESSGTYYQNINRNNACDSILAISVKIVSINDTIRRDSLGLMVEEDAADSYQWVDCNNADLPISGANQARFSPTQSGSYAVRINKENCTQISTCFNYFGVGIDPNFQASLSYYPNQTTDEIAIELGDFYSTVEIEIFHAMGQWQGSKKVNLVDRVFLELPEETGIYFLKIIADEKQGVIKVLKK